MASYFKILEQNERTNFDKPRALTDNHYEVYSALIEGAKSFYKDLRTDKTRLVFLLQYYYFSVNKRFYKLGKTPKKDLAFLIKKYRLTSLYRYVKSKQLDSLRKVLPERSALNYQKEIRVMLKWKAFDAKNREKLYQHCEQECAKRIEPRDLLDSAINFLLKNRIEIPIYSTMHEIVAGTYREAEEDLLENLNQLVEPELKQSLFALLRSNKGQMSRLAQLKQFEQSISDSALRQSAKWLDFLRPMFKLIRPILDELDLNDMTIDYYASFVLKSKLSRIKQLRPEMKLLQLTCFTLKQYYLRQDNAVRGFIKDISRKNNKAKNNYKQDLYKNREKELDRYLKISEEKQAAIDALQELYDVLNDQSMSMKERFFRMNNQIKDVLTGFKLEASRRATQGEDIEKPLVDRNKEYDYLEQLSGKFHCKLFALIEQLDFDFEDTPQYLKKAIEDFIARKDKWTIAFLKPKERKVVFRENGEIRPNLYKMLLFREMMMAFKSGKLNLMWSYQFRSFKRYLISDEEWKNNRDSILKKANLLPYANIHQLLDNLSERLHELFINVNERHADGKNPYLRVYSERAIGIETDPIELLDKKFISSQLIQEGNTPIVDVLRDINHYAKFTHLLTKHNRRNQSMVKNEDTVFAGLIGLGCNIGEYRMAKRSNGIDESSLLDMVAWRFSIDNLEKVNSHLVKEISELDLPGVYRIEDDKLYSSSDGKKISVAVESLDANTSFKYYGKGSGVALYSFLDEQQKLFHTEIFSPGKRESTYLIDGLLNHRISTPRIHATDTHGFTEAIFASTFLLDIGFAPRIKNPGKSKLFSLMPIKYYRGNRIRIRPTEKVNPDRIIENWDSVLRFIATIATGRASASQLFNRLNSYSREHETYKTLKEFGSIIKTNFLLNYFDDHQLRQNIQKQLNRVELLQAFNGAVFWDRSGEFYVASLDEQKKYALCRSILQNAVILWNYLELTERIKTIKSPSMRMEFIQSIARGSVLSWAHINFHGTYDFSPSGTKKGRFNREKLLKVNVPKITNNEWREMILH